MKADTTPTVLIVDDSPEILTLLSELLRKEYRVLAAHSGEAALYYACRAPIPDLILLDVMMPGMDGYTVLRKLRESEQTRDIPVIFVTSLNSSDNEEMGLTLGAVDYINKPFKPAIVLARVNTHLQLKFAREQLKTENTRLEEQVDARTKHLKASLLKIEAAHELIQKAYFGTLKALSAIVDLRGPAIGNHSRRVADLSRTIAEAMALTPVQIQNIFSGALLHDVGLIGMSDELVRKPHKMLNREEQAMYRRHPALAAEALAKVDALKDIAEIIRSHHEHYNGSGYPDGLKGTAIPLGARIVAVVSDYDDSRYGMLNGSNMSKADSIRLLLDGRGTNYDGKVVDELVKVLGLDEEIEEIKVTAFGLVEGMVVSRDVMHPDGFLLIKKDTVIDPQLKEQLITVHKEMRNNLIFYVLRQRKTT